MDGTFIMAIILAAVALGLTLFYRNRRAKLKSLTTDDTTKVTESAAEAKSANQGFEDGYGSSRKRTPSLADQRQQQVDLLKTITSIGRRVVIGVWVVTAFFLVLSSTAQVSTKNVGAVTLYGAPIDSYDNGLHLKWPPAVVTELDAADQVDTYKNGGDSGGCTTVRIANQATACVEYATKWKLRPEKAGEAFQAHRDFDNIKNSLVTSVLPAVGNEVFAGYDPLNFDDKGNSLAPSNAELSVKSTDALKKKSGNRIEVMEVIVTNVILDGPTQQRLNDLNAETAKTRTALQAQKTADAQAVANQKLAASLSKDPNVLTSRCFDLYELAINKGMQPPMAGLMGCWNDPNNAIALLGNGDNKPN